MATKEKCENVKRLLRSACYYKRENQKFNELIETAISHVIKVTPSYSQTPSGGNSYPSDKMADFANEVEYLTSKRDEMTRNYLKVFMEANDLIERLNYPIHKVIIRQRYLADYKWQDIAHEMKFSERRILQLHHEAIELLADIL